MSSTISSAPSTTVVAAAISTCSTAIPDKNGYVPYDACNARYAYYPSFTAAVFFAVVFGLSVLAHITQATLYKKWKLCWVVIMGVIWEFGGFLVRAFSTRDQQNDAFQIVSQILVLLAPMWINAFVYMVMGRMIYFYIPEQAIYGIKATKIAKIFVWLDVVAFLIQAGGGMMINPDNGAKIMNIGIKVYMGGISLQQVFIFGFLSIAIKFHLLMHYPSQPGQIVSAKVDNSWKWLQYTLYIILAAITTRIMYRLAEFSAGVEGPIHRHEAYFMVLDAATMVIACVMPNIIHPGRILRGEGSEFPKGLSRKEKKAAKEEAKRVKKEEKGLRKEEKKARKQKSKGPDELNLSPV